MKPLYLTILVAGILVLAGCAQQAANTAPESAPAPPEPAIPPGVDLTGNTVELLIESYSWGFNFEPPTIRKGDRVRLTLTSASGTHSIAIPGLDVYTDPVSPGQSTTVEFIASEAGRYPFACNIYCGAGHSSMVDAIEIIE